MKFENKGKWVKQINESFQKNESQIFIVEFNYDDGYAQGFGRGQCQVKANSEKEAIEKAEDYYAKKGRVGLFNFRVNKRGTKYSNDVVIESAQINETRGYKVLVELGVPDNMNNRDIEDEVERLLRTSNKINVVIDVTAERK